MKSKIIFLNYGLHIAGVSRALVNLANALVERGHDVTIKLETPNFTLASELDSRVKCELFFKEWRIFGKRIPGFLRCYHHFLKHQYKISPKLLHQTIVGKGYDVEIAFNRGSAARIIAASETNAKKLVWVHSDYLRSDNALAGFLDKTQAQKAYSKFDTIVCVSSQAEKSFRVLLGEINTTCVLHNPVDRQRIIALSKAPCKIPIHDKLTVCAVGRLSREKNFHMLINTHANLLKKGIDHRLIIVGEGPERPLLEQQIDSLGVGASVLLLGFQNNPYPYIRASDVTVCSSLYEGLHIASQESLVLGVPVVSCCSVIEEVFGDFQCGIITQNESHAFELGLEKILKNADFRNNCAQQAVLRGQQLGLSYAIEAFNKLVE